MGRGYLLKYLSSTHSPSLSSLQSLIHMKMTILTTATASGRTPASLNVYHRKPQVIVSTVSREASNSLQEYKWYACSQCHSRKISPELHVGDVFSGDLTSINQSRSGTASGYSCTPRHIRDSSGVTSWAVFHHCERCWVCPVEACPR